MNIQVCFVLSGIFAVGICHMHWLEMFACNPDKGDYSIINPNTQLTRAKILNKNSSTCSVSFTDDSKVLNVTDCPLRELSILFDRGSSSGLVGGIDAGTYVAACNYTTYGLLAEITGKATVVELSTDSGFDEEFVDSNPQVEMNVLSVQGVGGYKYFTVGYPMMVELVGPYGTKLLPKKCVAYSGLEVNGTRANKTMIENGCTNDSSLVFSFKADYTSWYEEGLTEPAGGDVDLMLTEGDETEEQPRLAANMFGFRFGNSKKMAFECEVKLCPSENTDCDFVRPA